MQEANCIAGRSAVWLAAAERAELESRAGCSVGAGMCWEKSLLSQRVKNLPEPASEAEHP